MFRFDQINLGRQTQVEHLREPVSDQCSSCIARSPWFVTIEENCEFLKIDKDEFATVKTVSIFDVLIDRGASDVALSSFRRNSNRQNIKTNTHWFAHVVNTRCGRNNRLTKWFDWSIGSTIRPTQVTSSVEHWALSFTREIMYLCVTVLASEGFRCPFIAFIKTGECHILRKVDVVKTAQNGNKVSLVFSFVSSTYISLQNRQIRQVVMGKIVAPNSFGEISVLQQEAMVSGENDASSASLSLMTS